MEPVAGTVIADRFLLERELGRGGMGAVWHARHLGLDVPCAIKLILAQAAASPEMRARFEREAKAAARIKSPHVVQILDYGVFQDTPFIAMEYLEGEDLAARLARNGRLGARETATIIGQVARALGKAHAMGIVHRDIKPSNIFLAREDDREVAKVVDFGIAKSPAQALGEGQTRTGALLGTPFYMSPEQAQGNRAIDHRADLWSLAVVTFQCLTGRLPFESDGFGDLMMKIMAHPIPPPSSFAPVPPALDAWWARAMARDPAQRFQTALELSQALYLALGISAPGNEDLHDSAPPPAPFAPVAQTVVLGSTPPMATPAGAVLPAAPGPPRRSPVAVALVALAVVGGAALLAVFLSLRGAPRPAGGAALLTTAAPLPATEQTVTGPPPAAPAPPTTAEPAAAPTDSASSPAPPRQAPWTKGKPPAVPAPSPTPTPTTGKPRERDFGI